MSTRFFDTNVILPAFIPRHANHARATALLAALGHERPHVTVTVLGELYSGLTRAYEKGGAPLLGHPAAVKAVVAFAKGFTVHDVTTTDWSACIVAKQKHPQWPIWDCLLWAGAKAARCTEFLTEDGPGGIDEFDGVRFVNPFEQAGAQTPA